MTMSFISIEFTDDSFNIVLRERNVCQVLIDNGSSWWVENTVILNNWALFCKKRIKEIGVFTKIINKLLSSKIGGVKGTFLSFNIVFSNYQ